MKITAVLIVDEVEKSLEFWTGRMRFEKTAEVPDGDRIGFAIVVSDGAELMLQTLESVRKDCPALAPARTETGVTLFIEVPDLSEIQRRLDGYPIAMAERTTFYGMREIGIREPGGHTIIFAAHA